MLNKLMNQTNGIVYNKKNYLSWMSLILFLRFRSLLDVIMLATTDVYVVEKNIYTASIFVLTIFDQE